MGRPYNSLVPKYIVNRDLLISMVQLHVLKKMRITDLVDYGCLKYI